MFIVFSIVPEMLCACMCIVFPGIDATPVVILPSSGDTLPESVVVGNASDIIVEIQCNSSSSQNTWTRDGVAVLEPLMTFGESQDAATGVLRIFDPSTVLSGPGPFGYTCTTAENQTAVISLVLGGFMKGGINKSLALDHRPS